MNSNGNELMDKLKIYFSNYIEDSLHRNSTLLVISHAINAGAGFVFWLLCARFFSVDNVGVAGAFIAYATLVSTITNLGISNSIIRFMPLSGNKSGLFNAILVVVSAASLIGALVALTIVKYVAPELNSTLLTSIGISILVILILLNTLSSVADSLLISFRKGEIVLGKSIINSVTKIVLIFGFVGFGVVGILIPHLVAVCACVAFTIYFITSRLIKVLDKKPYLDFNQLYGYRTFAAGNFSGNLLGILPGTLLPLIVLNQLGADNAAYFYITFQFAIFLSVVCGSISQAFFAEASQYNNKYEIRKLLIKSLKNMYLFLIPSILALSISGFFILSAYGRSYAENGYILLLILLFSSLFIGINWLGDTWLNVQKNMQGFFLMNALNSVLVVTMVFALAKYGLIWVGVGWLLAQFISTLVYLIVYGKKMLSVNSRDLIT